MSIPLLYLDTCIIFDIVRKRQPHSIILGKLIKGSEYLAIYSDVTLSELSKPLVREMPNLVDEIKRISDLMYEPGFRAVLPTHEVVLEVPRIIEFIGHKNINDAYHVAYSYFYKANYLVTKDNHILRVANYVRNKYAVEVIEPSLLVPVIYDRLEKVKGQKIPHWSPCIEKAKKRLKKPKFYERLLIANFFRYCLGYEKEKIHLLLSRALDYNREVTDRILEAYPPCVIFCMEIKENMRDLCPYGIEEKYCDSAMPLEEDIEIENEEERIAKTTPSPFYDYIRKAQARNP